MAANTRTVRFLLLATFSIIVLYKIFTSSYTGGIQNQAGPGGIVDQPRVPVPDSKPAVPKGPEVVEKPGVSNAKPKLPPDVHTHDVYPEPMVIPPIQAPGERVKATFVTLARNSDVYEIASSIRMVEDRFNHKFHYDWVFLNDKDFDERFKRITRSLVSGNTYYGTIPKEHWSFPEWIDTDKAAAVREEMRKKKVIYGDSISYRHMCRFESGFFFRHPLLDKYEYYWRVEPGIKLFCDIDFDPFKFMKDNNKKYAFTISLYEYIETIPTLWKSVQEFIKEHPEHIHPNNSMRFISDDGGVTYNRCHFWSNFEIGDLNFWRSKAYLDFFEKLDKDGGFFYERWGDAPVHSLAASLLLDKNDIHFFDEIGYYHVPFTHCPTNDKQRLKLKCHCDPKENFDWKGYSCTSRHFEAIGRPKPDGYENQMD